MSALNAMHGALRPDGLMLDIHPEPEHAAYEVHLGDQVVPLGQDDRSVQAQTIAVARATLEAVVSARQWIREREVSFTFLYHCEDIDDWLKYLADRRSDAVLAESLIERARALLAGGDGELRVRRRIHAARLRRA